MILGFALRIAGFPISDKPTPPLLRLCPQLPRRRPEQTPELGMAPRHPASTSPHARKLDARKTKATNTKNILGVADNWRLNSWDFKQLRKALKTHETLNPRRSTGTARIPGPSPGRTSTRRSWPQRGIEQQGLGTFLCSNPFSAQQVSRPTHCRVCRAP